LSITFAACLAGKIFAIHAIRKFNNIDDREMQIEEISSYLFSHKLVSIEELG
jgi:hypothetical protein